MTKIKLCGLSRLCDIEAANEIRPDYIGFVFSQKSKRYIRPEKAAELKKRLCPDIKTVGVFTDEKPENIAALLESGVIEIAQLHGLEDDKYVRQLKLLCKKPVIQAFQIQTAYDIVRAKQSAADFVLLDAGAGAGTTFDWKLITNIKRPYFLAGGLNAENIVPAIRSLHPYAADVSSGIETCGYKDKAKMAAFAAAVRKENTI